MPRIYPYDGRLGKAEVLDETEKSAVSAYADYQLSLLIICIESPEARFYKLFLRVLSIVPDISVLFL